MKKLVALGVAALLLASCGNRTSSESEKQMSLEEMLSMRLEKATTFEDTVIAVNGTFMGGYFNYNLHADPELSANLNMKEVERGIRQVIATDSADMSYIYGMQIGLSILDTYREISSDMPVDKGRLMDAVFASLRLDSIDREQLLEIRGEFERMDAEVKARHKIEQERKYFDEREAKENRMLADAVCAKLQSSPEYHQIDNTGIYRKTIKEGSGDLYRSNSRLKVTYSVRRLNGEPLETETGKSMYAGHAANPMLESVLVHMRPGEQAEFFVPYEKAYGVLGNEDEGIGYCESLFIEVTCE